ncbi:MAG: Dabb family protein [Capsulimonadaceae bacterium]
MFEKTGFFHNVFFYLRDCAEEGDPDKIIEGCLKYLRGIPGVIRISVGVPAGTDRAVVDNSYGVGLLVEFAGKQEHDAYQGHPDHLRFIEECGPYWERVKIYDTLAV